MWPAGRGFPNPAVIRCTNYAMLEFVVPAECTDKNCFKCDEHVDLCDPGFCSLSYGFGSEGNCRGKNAPRDMDNDSTDTRLVGLSAYCKTTSSRLPRDPS